jgi:hypothetical protein
VFATVTPTRTGPPEPAACGVRLPTTSFGVVYAANAELAKASVESAAHAKSAARIDFLIQCPFLLRSEREDGCR